jgi:hypothetical protein
MFFGTDFIDNDASFNTQLRKGPGGAIYVQAVVADAAAANTPVAVRQNGSTYYATALAASEGYAYVGVEKDGAAIASGCVGWIQIRGAASGVQAGAADVLCSQGHSIFWGAAALGASTSAYTMSHSSGQIGFSLADYGAGGCTTITMYFAGALATPKA